MPSVTDLDDDLFPRCAAGTVGVLHVDEYGVTYVSDLIDGLGAAWVSLGPATDPKPR